MVLALSMKLSWQGSSSTSSKQNTFWIPKLLLFTDTHAWPFGATYSTKENTFPFCNHNRQPSYNLQQQDVVVLNNSTKFHLTVST